MKRYDESIEAFNQMLKIEPSGEGRYNLGGALWESGRCEEAIAEYKTAESMGFVRSPASQQSRRDSSPAWPVRKGRRMFSQRVKASGTSFRWRGSIWE